jgi:hypothetical protein
MKFLFLCALLMVPIVSSGQVVRNVQTPLKPKQVYELILSSLNIDFERRISLLAAEYKPDSPELRLAHLEQQELTFIKSREALIEYLLTRSSVGDNSNRLQYVQVLQNDEIIELLLQQVRTRNH